MPQSNAASRFHTSLPEAAHASAGPRLAAVPRTERNGRPPQASSSAAPALEEFFDNPRHLARREVLYRTGDPFTALHLVRVGSLKSVALVDDGREQITGYSLAGDIVGIEGLGLASHTCDVVALEDSEVSVLSLARLDAVVQQPAALQALFGRMANDLHRGRELTVLLGSLNAEERVATFLLDLSQRHGERGDPSTELALRMTREEIASFLGLKLETVSRTFSRLHAEGLLRVRGRAVALMDIAGLKRIAGQEQPAYANTNSHLETGAENACRSR